LKFQWIILRPPPARFSNFIFSESSDFFKKDRKKNQAARRGRNEWILSPFAFGYKGNLKNQKLEI
jgi:hypothetical protein